MTRFPFRPIVSPRAHEEVAEQLRRQIGLRLVGPGGALPAERDLARLFGVGRATVQRAIRLLEAEGLVERRRGRLGGTFVVGVVDENGAGRLLGSLRRTGPEIEEALTFRLAVEPAAAALAALAAPDADRAAIAAEYEATAAASADAEFMEHDTAFHLAVGRASGNRFLAESVERVRLVLNDALEALPDSPAWHAWSNEEHGRIRDAIAARDAERARDAMAAHVLHADDAIRTLLASLALDRSRHR
ncbi:MAG TPA: FCD domain-containing protein [Gaiellaceae bacterium]|nr:FCD domain-containing protein [Gaiellaceae bacterium]